MQERNITFPCQIKNPFFASPWVLLWIIFIQFRKLTSLSLVLLELNETTPRKEFASGYFMQPFWTLREKKYKQTYEEFTIKLTSTVKEMGKSSPNEQYVRLLKVGLSAQDVDVRLAGKWARRTSLVGSLLFRSWWLWSAPIEVYLPQRFLYIECYFTKRILPSVAATISVFTWAHSYRSQSEFWSSPRAGQPQR